MSSPALFSFDAPAPLHVLAIGAHPDDAESGCGGALARFVDAGHRITVAYLTRGGRGIPNTGHDETCAVRTVEAEESCRILGATPLFLDEHLEQRDGATACTPGHISALAAIFMPDLPDLVFAPWPLDSHMDHQVASLLATRASVITGVPRLYFYEIYSGVQSLHFTPTHLADISPVLERKRAAIAAHVSQEGEERIYGVQTAPTEALRGQMIGVEAAEGFVAYPPRA